MLNGIIELSATLFLSIVEKSIIRGKYTLLLQKICTQRSLSPLTSWWKARKVWRRDRKKFDCGLMKGTMETFSLFAGLFKNGKYLSLILLI